MRPISDGSYLPTTSNVKTLLDKGPASGVCVYSSRSRSRYAVSAKATGNLSKPLLPRAQMRGSSSRVWGCRTPSVTIIVVSLARTRDSLGNWSMSPLAAKGPSGRPAIILS